MRSFSSRRICLLIAVLLEAPSNVWRSIARSLYHIHSLNLTKRRSQARTVSTSMIRKASVGHHSEAPSLRQTVVGRNRAAFQSGSLVVYVERVGASRKASRTWMTRSVLTTPVIKQTRSPVTKRRTTAKITTSSIDLPSSLCPRWQLSTAPGPTPGPLILLQSPKRGYRPLSLHVHLPPSSPRRLFVRFTIMRAVVTNLASRPEKRLSSSTRSQRVGGRANAMVGLGFSQLITLKRSRSLYRLPVLLHCHHHPSPRHDPCPHRLPAHKMTVHTERQGYCLGNHPQRARGVFVTTVTTRPTPFSPNNRMTTHLLTAMHIRRQTMSTTTNMTTSSLPNQLRLPPSSGVPRSRQSRARGAWRERNPHLRHQAVGQIRLPWATRARSCESPIDQNRQIRWTAGRGISTSDLHLRMMMKVKWTATCPMEGCCSVQHADVTTSNRTRSNPKDIVPPASTRTRNMDHFL